MDDKAKSFPPTAPHLPKQPSTSSFPSTERPPIPPLPQPPPLPMPPTLLTPPVTPLLSRARLSISSVSGTKKGRLLLSLPPLFFICIFLFVGLI
ncbi:hypothetical protein LguiB_028780 [Lonicera macranthoides]